MALTGKPHPEIATWPPKGYKKEHQVTSVDNWWKLAKDYGLSDPWDIIKFNFDTDNPKEVNYYLHKYVGCRTETTDGNYRFSSADSPGKIYIPPDGWKPGGSPSGPVLDPKSEAARRTVLNVLADYRLAKVGYTYKGFTVSWSLLIAVANKIIDRKIMVKFDSGQGTQAEYDPDTNTIFIGFTEAERLSQRALIVHEAVHAGLDLKKAGTLLVAEAETAAYIAHARYALEIFPDGKQLTDDSPWQQHIYDVAWIIAKALQEGKKLGELGLEVFALETAIRKEGKYKKNAWKNAGYNGI